MADRRTGLTRSVALTGQSQRKRDRRDDSKESYNFRENHNVYPRGEEAVTEVGLGDVEALD